jgi:1-acyl-sn-glycerol-3-phosphate acyltransferase
MERVVSAFLWAWGSFLLGLFGSVIILASLVLPMQCYDPALKWMCRTLLRALGIRVRVEGVHNLRPEQTYLFMSNHVNIFDVFVLGGYLPHLVRGVELESHFRWFFYGLVIRRIGNIPISHHRPFRAMESLRQAREALRRGVSIVILPEGHRTLDGQLRQFKRAPFDMARQAEVDLVPVAMVNAFRINRKGSWLIRPGRLTLRIGKPIPYAQLRTLDSRVIKDHVRESIARLIAAPMAT